VVYVEREHCFSAYSPINFADPTGDYAKPVSCPPARFRSSMTTKF
jgi:hypothetical protein